MTDEEKWDTSKMTSMIERMVALDNEEFYRLAKKKFINQLLEPILLEIEEAKKEVPENSWKEMVEIVHNKEFNLGLSTSIEIITKYVENV